MIYFLKTSISFSKDKHISAFLSLIICFASANLWPSPKSSTYSLLMHYIFNRSSGFDWWISAKPSSRIVYLREFKNNNFFFYTNYNSKKSLHLSKNPNASISFFFWTSFISNSVPGRHPISSLRFWKNSI